MTKQNYKLRIFLVVISLFLISAILLFQVIYPPELIFGASGDEVLEIQRREWHQQGTFRDDRVTEFVFKKGNNSALICDIKGYFIGDDIYCFFPNGTDISSLVLSYRTSDNGALRRQSKLQISGLTKNDYSGEVVFTHNNVAYRVVPLFTTLPVMCIETLASEPIYTRDYVTSSTRFYDEKGSYLDSAISAYRVRGNSSFTAVKKSYKMKTSNAMSPYGLPLDDQFTLIGNVPDPSLIRNALSFDLARALGMQYVPNMVYVELYVNGEYRGVLTLGTQIRLSPGCIDLPELSADGKDGSFLVEIDAFSFDMLDTYITELGVPIVIKSPSNPNDTQRETIYNLINQFEYCLQNNFLTEDGRHCSEIIDIDTFADIYFVNEVYRNRDVNGMLSIFLYRDEAGKLCMGPVWDMEHTIGEASEAELDSEPEGTSLNKCWWFGYLANDPVFRDLVDEKYANLSDYWKSLSSVIDEYDEYLSPSFFNNTVITYVGTGRSFPVVPEPSTDLSQIFIGEVRVWLDARIAWLDENGFWGEFNSL